MYVPKYRPFTKTAVNYYMLRSARIITNYLLAISICQVTIYENSKVCFFFLMFYCVSFLSYKLLRYP